MAHCIIPEAEEILDKEYPVLDHGFVRLVDYLGGDDRIVQAARVSYGKGTKTVRQNKGLIRYLLMHEHMSPFEQVIFTFHIKMPIFVARQWVRHRTARMNEISGRYSVMENEFYLPARGDVSYQSASNRQGRSDEELPEELTQRVLHLLKQSYEQVYTGYSALIDENISREIARINLPLSLYTQMYWQIDLRNLLHFIKLRGDVHAQKEIRLYADVLKDIVKKVTPFAWEAFEEFQLYAVKLSRTQVQKLATSLQKTDPALLKELGIDDEPNKAT
ncbi:MAG: FAD-dependent thymidylate synthase [Spirochaetales bacterium]|nr:FAD-dependent thymidylate synthase [Spirochaetales bacterium]